MYCPNCRTELISGAKFCPNCGRDLQQRQISEQPSQASAFASKDRPPEPSPLPSDTTPASPEPPAPPIQTPAQTPNNNVPVPAPTTPHVSTTDERKGLASRFRAKQLELAQRESLGMKWYKFNVYFLLLFNAVTSLGGLGGAIKQFAALSEYLSYYPSLGSILGFRCIMYLIEVPLYIYTWYLLMRFSQKAIGMFFTTFWVNIIMTIIYLIWQGGNNIINSSYTYNGAYIGGYVGGVLLVGAIAIAAYYLPNRKYFNKRAHLFTND